MSVSLSAGADSTALSVTLRVTFLCINPADEEGRTGVSMTASRSKINHRPVRLIKSAAVLSVQAGRELRFIAAVAAWSGTFMTKSRRRKWGMSEGLKEPLIVS